MQNSLKTHTHTHTHTHACCNYHQHYYNYIASYNKAIVSHNYIVVHISNKIEISAIICMYTFLVLGPPSVILNCSADYLTLRKTIELSWKPSLIRNDTSITSEIIDDHFTNCIIRINCSNGYTTWVSLAA